MKNREILQQPRTVFVQAVKVFNLETRRVDRNETIGVGNRSADRVISSASGKAVEHSVELSIDAASLHLCIQYASIMIASNGLMAALHGKIFSNFSLSRLTSSS